MSPSPKWFARWRLGTGLVRPRSTQLIDGNASPIWVEQWSAADIKQSSRGKSQPRGRIHRRVGLLVYPPSPPQSGSGGLRRPAPRYAPVGAEDLALAEEIALRAALAIDKGRRIDGPSRGAEDWWDKVLRHPTYAWSARLGSI